MGMICGVVNDNANTAVVKAGVAVLVAAEKGRNSLFLRQNVDEILPTSRARRMIQKPLVDALPVERVVAFRQNANFLAVGKVRQADGAVPVHVGVRRLGVSHGGQCLHGRLLQPLVVHERRRCKRSPLGGGAAPPRDEPPAVKCPADDVINGERAD